MILKLNSNFQSHLGQFLDLLFELESYDQSRIDEPDHERRYRAFEKLGQVLFFFKEFFILYCII